MAISLLLSGNDKKGNVVMGKIRKSVFIIKVAPFCLVFFLVCLSSAYALAETKQNKRFILKNIPLEQIGSASRAIIMKSSYKGYNYLVKSDFTANQRLFFDKVEKRRNTGNYLMYAGSDSKLIFDKSGSLRFEGIMFYAKKLDNIPTIEFISSYVYLLRIWTVNSEHNIIGNVEYFGYQVESNSEYPFVFKMVKDKGYTYLCGRGTITDKDGKTYKLGYEDTVDTWLPLIKSNVQLAREGAAQALGWLAKTKEDKDKVVPALIGALTDNAMEIRRDSVESLGRIGDSRAKESLEKIAKEDKDDWVREVAEESVGLIEVKIASEKLAGGDKTAIAELSKALDHKWFLVRRTAVESLAKGGADAIEPLVKALKNDDSETRINSAKSLAEISDKRTIEPLKSALTEEKDEDVKKAFEEAIKKLEK